MTALLSSVVWMFHRNRLTVIGIGRLFPLPCCRVVPPAVQISKVEEYPVLTVSHPVANLLIAKMPDVTPTTGSLGVAGHVDKGYSGVCRFQRRHAVEIVLHLGGVKVIQLPAPAVHGVIDSREGGKHTRHRPGIGPVIVNGLSVCPEGVGFSRDAITVSGIAVDRVHAFYTEKTLMELAAV